MNTRPVGLTRDLPAGRVMHAEADGKDIAVWRATDGTIAAWDNRCPHRGMALSHGFVRGNQLACLYHGWHYDSGGRCRYIPAHPDLEPPATIHATGYGIVEAGGVIWIAVEGEPEGQETDLAPLRTFIVEAGEAAVLAATRSTPFGEIAPEVSGGATISLGEDSLTVLMNPIGPARTQVTVLVSGGLGADRLQALSRWCEAMRRHAEKEGTS